MHEAVTCSTCSDIRNKAALAKFNVFLHVIVLGQVVCTVPDSLVLFLHDIQICEIGARAADGLPDKHDSLD